MCNCIKNTEKELRGLLNKPDAEKPKDGELKSISCKSMFLMFDTGKSALSIPFAADWRWKTRAGQDKRTEKTIPVIASHCPFCGEKFEQPEEEEGN
jgi:hypothetical protein